MTLEERARRLANEMARHIVGEALASLDETCATCVGFVMRALRAAVVEEREACRQIADERAAACRQAVERYQHQYPAEPQWAASERCALREAEHIAERIRARSTDPAATSAQRNGGSR